MRTLLLGTAASLLLSACAAPRAEPRFTVAPADYPRVFAAAKEALVAARFELDRVDARAGVITTRPKPTSGVATPWDGEQSSPGQEVEDLLNRQYRRIRVTFEPAPESGGGGAPAGEGAPAQPDPLADRRAAVGPLTATVEVTIDRLCRPGWRVQTSSVRLSSFAFDPELARRDMWPQYTVPFAQDPAFAERLAASIQRRLTP